MGRYKLLYLPSARQDMIEIVRYVSKELKNPTAANSLAVELVEASEDIPEFPYANPVYMPIRPLKHEYRKVLVKIYMIFYWIDEEKKTVVIYRVIYAKRKYTSLLE